MENIILSLEDYQVNCFIRLIIINILMYFNIGKILGGCFEGLSIIC